MSEPTERDWCSPNEKMPEDGETVWTMNSAGTVTKLTYEHNLWWFPDKSMYVYYVPTFWKRLTP